MGSRKEEERNEKIIRGLMKLPPNRKCINCNSLGPQYVCTNFWTFICMTCSGIHREFTHRVKSISMAKFTSQEVEALQNGGNQCARDVYLRDWDFQMQRLPDSSNVDKIREFIRNVYVDRRYTGSKSSGKPPRDNQSPTLHDDETRRASSYHSYSQSPPYDYQYEDRRYGKQAAALTRKPGSDKGRYEGKISSFIYSPGLFSDHAYHDKFSNEESVPRISDYTVSNRSEQFKSDVQSTEFHKDIGFSNHSGSCEDIWSQARNTSLEIKAKRDADEIHHPKRTTLLGSTDNNLSSFRSLSSGGLVDFFPEPVQTSGSLLDKVSAVQPPSGPAISVDLDLSKEPEPFSSSASSIDLFQLSASSQPPSVDLFQSSASSAPFLNENQPTFQPSSIDLFAPFSHQQSAATSEGKSPELFEPFSSSSSSIDLFQLPASSQPPSVDLFQSSASSIPSFNENQPTFQTSSIDLFAPFSHQQSASPSEEKSPELSVAKNEGWATFDMPQFTASATQVENPAEASSTNKSSPENFDPFSTFNASIQWPSFEISSVQEPFSVALNPQHDGARNGEEQASITATISQPWNAFEDSGTELPVNALNQGLELHDLPSTSGQYLVGFRTPEGFDRGGMQGVAPVGGFKSFDDHNIPSNVASSQPDPQSLIPVMGEVQANKIRHKSTNPFDLPFDSDIEQNNMLLDMSSLQAALPDAQLPPTYPSSIAEPWLTQNSVNSYISSAGQGGLTYLAAQPPSSQLLSIQTQEPVAAFGGNPFA